MRRLSNEIPFHLQIRQTGSASATKRTTTRGDAESVDGSRIALQSGRYSVHRCAAHRPPEHLPDRDVSVHALKQHVLRTDRGVRHPDNSCSSAACSVATFRDTGGTEVNTYAIAAHVVGNDCRWHGITRAVDFDENRPHHHRQLIRQNSAAVAQYIFTWLRHWPAVNRHHQLYNSENGNQPRAARQADSYQ